MRGNYEKPWLLASVHVVNRLVEAQRVLNGVLGLDERVAVFFDRQDEFSGRVNEMMKTVVAEAGYPIGVVGFDDSVRQPGLQAADLFAYEARRCLTEVVNGNKAPRWQWMQLQDAVLPGGEPRLAPPDYWDPATLDFVAVMPL